MFLGYLMCFFFFFLFSVLTSDKPPYEGENEQAKTLMTAAGHDKWVLSLQKLFAKCYCRSNSPSKGVFVPVNQGMGHEKWQGGCSNGSEMELPIG